MRSINAVSQHYQCVKVGFLLVTAATLALHVLQTGTSVNVLDSCFVTRSDADIDHAAAPPPHSAADIAPSPPDSNGNGNGNGKAAAGSNAAHPQRHGKKAKQHHRVLFGLLTHAQSESLKWSCLAVCFVVLCCWSEEAYEHFYYQTLADRIRSIATLNARADGASAATAVSGGGGAVAASAVPPMDDYPPVWSGVWLSVTYTCLSYVWYLSVYFLCNALKSLLDDHTCHTRHGNSVSGHYLFHIFAMSQLYHLHIMQRTLRVTEPLPYFARDSAAPAPAFGSAEWQARVRVRLQRWVERYVTADGRAKVFSVAFGLFAILSVNTLVETYFWGFHSLRQVLYGTALALLAQWLLLNLLHTFLHVFPTHGHAYHVARYFASHPEAGHIGMTFPRPRWAHDVLNALPSLSSNNNTRPIFPLFLHAAAALLQVVCLTAVVLSRDQLVYANDIIACALLWGVCFLVYRYRLRTAALMAAKLKQR